MVDELVAAQMASDGRPRPQTKPAQPTVTPTYAESTRGLGSAIRPWQIGLMVQHSLRDRSLTYATPGRVLGCSSNFHKIASG